MNFVSPVFLPFLIVTLILLRLVPAKHRRLILLPASWVFYAWHSVPLLGLLLLATVAAYGCAIGMDNSPKYKRPFFLLGCGTLLGMLFVFKYLDFAVGGLCTLFSIKYTAVGLILPMGISFYTFQTLSYLIDVRKGRFPAERNFILFALFVSFFPQLVAGPIERPQDLLPQLREPQQPDRKTQAEALRILLIGFAKKVMIADSIAPYVQTAYNDPQTAGGAALILATALFAVQIYCDFSGYTDIAAGCAALMGIRLSKNFDMPYTAVTVRDFWRRWHISLTRWFTDYVYIPLGGNRNGKARQILNILIVFLLSGLWHGADITFVVWGLLHGLYLSVETLLPRKPRFPWLRRCVTLLLVGFAWIFFRADNWNAAITVLHTIFADFNAAHLLSGLGGDITMLVSCAALLLMLPLLDRLPVLGKGKGYRAELCTVLLIILIVLYRILTVSQGVDSVFLYFQF